jgi:hypothetical protein
MIGFASCTSVGTTPPGIELQISRVVLLGLEQIDLNRLPVEPFSPSLCPELPTGEVLALGGNHSGSPALRSPLHSRSACSALRYGSPRRRRAIDRQHQGRVIRTTWRNIPQRPLRESFAAMSESSRSYRSEEPRRFAKCPPCLDQRLNLWVATKRREVPTGDIAPDGPISDRVLSSCSRSRGVRNLPGVIPG